MVSVCLSVKVNAEFSINHRRNRPMEPVGRVPSNFGDHGDQVYLVPSNFCPWLPFCRCALWETYSASTDLSAEFKVGGKKSRNG